MPISTALNLADAKADTTWQPRPPRLDIAFLAERLDALLVEIQATRALLQAAGIQRGGGHSLSLAEAEADALAYRAVRAHRRRQARLLLSLREAASRLGVGRGTTLAALIATGQLRTVEVNGKARIEARELERLASTGFDSNAALPRRSPRRAAAARPDDWSLV